MTLDSLEQLRQHTTIVVDSADFDALPRYTPQDVTTNPLHILTATQLPKFDWILEDAARYGLAKSQQAAEQDEAALLKLLVTFGTEILKRIPGRTSTEVDAIHSFDEEATIRVAREIIALYDQHGVSKERVLIKIVSTWEGLQAARVLENEYGIHCNMTAIFSFHQAALAAEAGCTLVSPFVARTTDWYYKNKPQRDYTGWKGPGVKLVDGIYKHYKAHDIKTEIMAASVRTMDEVSKLSGLDLMTLNVGTLTELQSETLPMTKSLDAAKVMTNGHAKVVKPVFLDNEPKFRLAMFLDQPATDKLDEAIRIFLDAGKQTSALLRAKMDKVAGILT
ncbi:Transaldolase [Elasticomyces elasticus]|uniref:transaldolase n=1 Tax=Exophiala sideris TaxID=1016849 RepID=A0ABR0JD47_9EURO|nr:Transaldolase [Elasticomyces elasticus]KAK5031974.1 hypothetical protein LTS07_004595 [Exophiala sideris]KAK5040903.1 Transaldolase [Exophiala sideris]KAK5061763.1 hypothetical protein LTR69_004946 [Exophiala sideris]KAK5184463.1 hypothetical protein LTR44_003137 [Eurotiomycetes sp. CCFEE 6388]